MRQIVQSTSPIGDVAVRSSYTRRKGLFCVKCHDFYCNYCWQTNGVLVGPYDESGYSDLEDGDYICQQCEN